MDLDHSLLTRHWHLLCHRQELPAPGDYLRLETAIGDVVVFNDGIDLVVFDNRCAHRGSLIYDGTHGNRAATCGYHGWTFARGVLIIPQREQFSDCDLTQACLNTYQTDWCGDFLFFAVDPAQELYAQLDDTVEILENISFNIAGRADFNQYIYDCYWPLAVENALEPYHISLVHPQTLATLQLEDGTNSYYGINSVWRAALGNARLHKQLSGLKRFFNIDYGYEGYFSLYLFPFTMLSSTFGYSYSLQHFLPRDARGTSTTFVSRLLTGTVKNEQAASVLSSFFSSTAQVNRKVFDEDHQICRRMPRDTWSMAPLRFASATEEKIQHFRTSCRQHFSVLESS